MHQRHSHGAEDADRDDVDDLFDSARALAGLPKLSRGKGKVAAECIIPSVTSLQRKTEPEETAEDKAKRAKLEAEEADRLAASKVLWQARQWLL